MVWHVCQSYKTIYKGECSEYECDDACLIEGAEPIAGALEPFAYDLSEDGGRD